MEQQDRERFLLFRIKRFRDENSFREIYLKYQPQLLRYLTYKLPSKADAEDLVSDVFLKAWEYLQTAESVQYLRALLYKIARNDVATFYQRKERRGVQIELNEQTIALFDEKNATFQEHEDELDVPILSIDIIKRWVRMLDGDYRDVLHMRYFDELPIKEIAEVIGKTENNTRVILHRALKTLRERYANQRTQNGSSDHQNTQSSGEEL